MKKGRNARPEGAATAWAAGQAGESESVARAMNGSCFGVLAGKGKQSMVMVNHAICIAWVQWAVGQVAQRIQAGDDARRICGHLTAIEVATHLNFEAFR